MKIIYIILCIIVSVAANAQQVNNIIRDGNDAYTKGDYKAAESFYKDALSKEANNITASFNLGNALMNQHNFPDALKYYTTVAENTDDNELKAKALYNKGLALAHLQQLPDAIESFKQALALQPTDDDTRENLQKAINDLKKQQPPPPRQQKKQNPKKQNKQPDKNMMEQKFEELRDKEKQLQKMLQKKPTGIQPEKDW